MRLLLVTLIGAMTSPAIATPAVAYTGPRDMSAECADSVAARLSERGSSVEQFLEKPYSVSFSWADEIKSQVQFVIQFDEDVRDGYAAGQVGVAMDEDGRCEVGKVDSYDIGD